MRIMSKIKALFQFRGKAAELEVSSVEIKQGMVFLHPVNEPDRIVCIKSNAVDVVISPHEDIRERDVQIIDLAKRKKTVSIDGKKAQSSNSMEQQPEITSEREKTDADMSLERKPLSHFMPKKKVISISLYEDEYDMLMDNIKASGFQKTEYLLGCVDAAKKNSMDAACRRYTIKHKERRTADRQAAYLAQERDYLMQQIRVRQEVGATES